METASQTALRLLGRRALTAAELRERLGRREFAPAEIEAAVAAMQDYGYINDSAVATCVAQSAESRGRGPGWVRNTLRRRGIGEDLAETAAATCYSESDNAVSTARALLARRFGEAALDWPQKQKAYRFLCYRGFAPDCVRAAIGALAEPMEDDL